MIIIHKEETKQFKNSDTCIATEYLIEDKDINGAVIELNGRYPNKKRVANLKCKEMAYVVDGFGKIVVEEKEIKLKKGDLILIQPGEKYFFDGNLTMFISCTPAWYPEQHKEVE